MSSDMIARPNVLHRLQDDRDVYITLQEYQDEQNSLFERLLNGAFRSEKISEEDYRILVSEVDRFNEWEPYYQHLTGLYERFIESMQKEIQRRIVAGATYIEAIGSSHKNYMPALRKYDALCREYQRSRGIGA